MAYHLFQYSSVYHTFNALPIVHAEGGRRKAVVHVENKDFSGTSKM